MRADAFFAAADLLPLGDLDALIGPGGLVVVAPHPDDESLGCGGLITEACARGREVRLVVLSDGCGSHTHSLAYPPARLRALREAETLRAAVELGLPAAHVAFLGLPDAAVPSAGPVAEAAAARVIAAASACSATAVAVTWRHDPHCDHAAAAAVVDLARHRLGVRVLAYPVWGRSLPSDHEVGPAPCGFRFEVGLHRDAKRRAVAAHASQTTGLISDDPEGFRLDEAMIDRLCGPFEIYLEDTA